MKENLSTADSDEHPKDPSEDKNENVFLREAESQNQVPAIRITSIILVITGVIMTLILLSRLGEQDPSPKKSHQEETKQTETHTEEP